MEFSRQVNWSGLPFAYLGNLPNSGNQTWVSCITGRFSAIWATREALVEQEQEKKGSLLAPPPSRSCVGKVSLTAWWRFGLWKENRSQLVSVPTTALREPAGVGRARQESWEGTKAFHAEAFGSWAFYKPWPFRLGSLQMNSPLSLGHSSGLDPRGSPLPAVLTSSSPATPCLHTSKACVLDFSFPLKPLTHW